MRSWNVLLENRYIMVHTFQFRDIDIQKAPVRATVVHRNELLHITSDAVTRACIEALV